MFKLKIITSTVRQGRKGPDIASWMAAQVIKHRGFEAEVIELGTLDLPLNTEPEHPKLQQYQYEHTKKWSRIIDQADAFIFVVAEYNNSYPAPLKNALDYLVREWGYKPAGFVSYAGVSAGTRATNALKEVLATLKIVPIFEAVNFPFFTQYYNLQGQFEPGEVSEKAADALLNELLLWTKGLSTMRRKINEGLK